MPDDGPGRCDGHHEMVDSGSKKSLCSLNKSQWCRGCGRHAFTACSACNARAVRQHRASAAGFVVVLDVTLNQMRWPIPGQDVGQGRFAELDRNGAEIVAEELNQAEGIQKHAGVAAAVTDPLEAWRSAPVAGDCLAVDPANPKAASSGRLRG